MDEASCRWMVTRGRQGRRPFTREDTALLLAFWRVAVSGDLESGVCFNSFTDSEAVHRVPEFGLSSCAIRAIVPWRSWSTGAKSTINRLGAEHG